jgi:hypothetical protein
MWYTRSVKINYKYLTDVVVDYVKKSNNSSVMAKSHISKCVYACIWGRTAALYIKKCVPYLGSLQKMSFLCICVIRKFGGSVYNLAGLLQFT